MAHKDLDKRRACNRKSYERNKSKCDQRAKDRKARLRQLATSLATPCVDCGNYHPAYMEWHHVDPTTKDLPIGRMLVTGVSRQRLLDEIDKCISLCCNCHRLRHYSPS